MLAALVDGLSRLGALRIVVMECGDQVVAASINAVQGKRLLAFFATYDPVVARASPGIMLMTHYIRWALDNGISEIDFLRGEEVYKFEFANHVVELDVFVAGRSAVGAAVLAAYRLWAVARRYRTSGKEAPKPAIGSAYFTEKGTLREAAPAKTTEQIPA
jgi:CelD/BcsL family acetyltransferase involved in cellulose biosynthesis